MSKPTISNDSDLTKETFMRTAVLESMLIEILGIVSEDFADPPAFRAGFFQHVRQRYAPLTKDETQVGAVEFATAAIRITDTIETQAIGRFGSGKTQS